MKNCLFCKIANKEIPANIVYEDQEIVAFLDLNQITDGHTLIVPKIHSRNLLETNQDTVHSLMTAVNKVSEILAKSLNAKGFNVISNINEEAGQSVFHTHIHVIPRYNKEEFDYKYHSREITQKHLSLLMDKITSK